MLRRKKDINLLSAQQTDINGNIIKTFKGVRIAMKELKISQAKLKDIIVNKKLYLEIYYLKFK